MTDRVRTADINGRAYAKLSKLKAGDKIEVDGGFTCLQNGAVKIVSQDDLGLYVECDDGHHYLDSQGDDGEHLIGMYPAT